MMNFGPRTLFDLQIAHIALQALSGSALLFTDIFGKTGTAVTMLTIGVSSSILSLLLYGKYIGQPGVK